MHSTKRRVPQNTLQTSVPPRAWPQAITPEGYVPAAFYSRRNWCWLADRKIHHSKPQLNFCPQYWFQTFPFRQFHVLFNSLFKVLFIFPSRYLFAIGLSPIFSFRWYLPPILVCIPKQTDSWKTYHIEPANQSKTGFSPSMMSCSKELVLAASPENASLNYNSHWKPVRFQIWAHPASLAVTRGILVSFFSSAYWYA